MGYAALTHPPMLKQWIELIKWDEIQVSDSKHKIILVADDSESDRDIIERAIRKGRMHCTLKKVGDGEQLLQYLQRQPPFNDEQLYPWPDLVLLDINMPRLNGKEALRQLRQLPACKLLPVVILTTSSREKDVLESYKLGVNGYITKPIESKDFINVVLQLETFWLELAVRPPVRRDPGESPENTGI